MTRRLLPLVLGIAISAPLLTAGEVPRPAPELAVPLPDGQQILLSKYKGKVVLVEFLHTTCPHCQHSSVIIQKLFKELGPKGFQPIGVAFNENALMLLPDFIRQTGATFPIGVGNRDEVISYLEYPLIKPLYVPQMVIIDRKGMIRAEHGGPDDTFLQDLETNLRATVLELLKEPARASAKSRTSTPRATKSAAR